MRPAHLIKVLEREFLSANEGLHTPVMLWGPPGVGKSQIVLQIASSHGAKVIDVRLSQMEPSELRGIPMRVDDFVEWAINSRISVCRAISVVLMIFNHSIQAFVMGIVVKNPIVSLRRSGS